MPDYASVLDQEGLRRLVSHTESLSNRIRQPAIFNYENGAASQGACAFREIDELLVGLLADRTLRAMLENQDGIGSGFNQKLFQIMVLQ